MLNLAELGANLKTLEPIFLELWQYLMVQERQRADAEIGSIHDNFLQHSLIKETAAHFQQNIFEALFDVISQCMSLKPTPFLKVEEFALWQTLDRQKQINALMWLTMEVAEKTSLFMKNLSGRPHRGSRFVGYGLNRELHVISFADFFITSTTLEIEPEKLAQIFSLKTKLVAQIKDKLAPKNLELTGILEQLVKELLDNFRSKLQTTSDYSSKNLGERVFRVAWHDLERSYFLQLVR